ncbi:hypothetical protein BK816_08660 [Boudabousia tangfeifanii]|uniref:Uncharacterized protein n=1 Tax=Boudabousia tangfeifanii TaxID=1912795 RepID=A0A1D9MME0_9ACTO|nr:ABC transporter permease [Boudabousia tangfeifanii]AOZ73333.1 hypothetical protein BK816_08660 [Boudabousia tangfeifanii]
MKTYFLTELKHQLLSPYQIFFAVIMPLGMYVIFGGMNEVRAIELPSGANISAVILINMAFYSAVLAAGMSGSEISQDREVSWSRTLYLVGVHDRDLWLVRASIAYLTTLVPVTLLYVAGYFSYAKMPTSYWIGTYLGILVVSGLFSAVGQLLGCYLPASAAGGVTSGIIVFSAFASDLFNPLEGTMFTVAKFMPLFGLKSLLTWALTEGKSAIGTDLNWVGVWANSIVWLAILALVGLAATRKARQQG